MIDSLKSLDRNDQHRFEVLSPWTLQLSSLLVTVALFVLFVKRRHTVRFVHYFKCASPLVSPYGEGSEGRELTSHFVCLFPTLVIDGRENGLNLSFSLPLIFPLSSSSSYSASLNSLLLFNLSIPQYSSLLSLIILLL